MNSPYLCICVFVQMIFVVHNRMMISGWHYQVPLLQLRPHVNSGAVMICTVHAVMGNSPVLMLIHVNLWWFVQFTLFSNSNVIGHGYPVIAELLQEKHSQKNQYLNGNSQVWHHDTVSKPFYHQMPCFSRKVSLTTQHSSNSVFPLSFLRLV